MPKATVASSLMTTIGSLFVGFMSTLKTAKAWVSLTQTGLRHGTLLQA
jgi:hypothetical protein